MKIAAGFLAGGLARRMGGGDKAEIQLAGRSLLDWQLAKTTHIDVRLINANGPAARLAHYGLPVVADKLSGYLGPLAGIHALLHHLQKAHPDITHLLSFATDAPFVPADLDRQLIDAAKTEKAEIIMAASGGRHHPVFALWPVSLCAALEQAINEDEVRKIDDFTAGYHTALVEFSGTPDPFMNINSPEDLAKAEALISHSSVSK